MKRPLITLGLLLAALAAGAGPGAHGPNGEHLDAPGAANASGLARLPDGSVNVPKLAQRRLGVRTLLAPQTQAAATLELPGRVVQDPNASGRVQASHGGRIAPGPQGLPVPGQAVRQGDILAWLHHHADPFSQANQEAQRAELRAGRQLAEQRLKRLEGLEGTVPRKEIDAARLEADAWAARERSIAASLDAREPLRAPVSGVIARTELVAGQVIDARDVLVEIVDPTRLMVEAQTPDVTLGSRIASAALAGVSGVTLQLAGVPRALRDGTLPLSFRVRGEQAVPLAVGQTVSVIVALNERRPGIVLPAEAVVRSPVNEPVVWIKTGAERYVPQPVQVLPLDAKTVLVTRGLAADNRVVVQGAPLIAQIR
ncbi:efflux RND transporter periplasmic adaptor subunit [Roseateles sp. BYS87W]|uniref:Efflux RND transporter periplasmic adaptor subunit n=1 Tax=Pelomonas baiyunensis TaxID=3299026 RepID=A0ABW7H543_9BURK